MKHRFAMTHVFAMTTATNKATYLVCLTDIGCSSLRVYAGHSTARKLRKLAKRMRKNNRGWKWFFKRVNALGPYLAQTEIAACSILEDRSFGYIPDPHPFIEGEDRFRVAAERQGVLVEGEFASRYAEVTVLWRRGITAIYDLSKSLPEHTVEDTLIWQSNWDWDTPAEWEVEVGSPVLQEELRAMKAVEMIDA